jgi:hypothetical protein
MGGCKANTYQCSVACVWCKHKPPSQTTNTVCPGSLCRSTAEARERLAQARTHGWRARASRALGAWHAFARARSHEARLQEQLTWHHVQHVQASAWGAWRQALKARCPHMERLRYAYLRRGRRAMRRVRHRRDPVWRAASSWLLCVWVARICCCWFRRTPLACPNSRRCPDARRQALLFWRGWAPVSRAKRRHERDKLASMARWRRQR